MEANIILRLLGLTHSGNFFQQRTLVAIGNLLEQLANALEVELDAHELDGIRTVAFRMLQGFGWIEISQPVSQLYRLSARGREAHTQIQYQRNTKAREFEEVLNRITGAFDSSELAFLGCVDHKVLGQALTAAAILAESKGEVGAACHGVSRPWEDRKQLDDRYGKQVVDWAIRCYSFLIVAGPDSPLHDDVQRLRGYAEYVTIANSFVEWQQVFSLQGSVRVILDPSILVALVAPGDRWHTLAKSVLDRIRAFDGNNLSNNDMHVRFHVTSSCQNLWKR